MAPHARRAQFDKRRAGRTLPRLKYDFMAAERWLRFAPSTLVASQTASNGLPPDPDLARIQSVVQRVGEICLSPEMAQLMLNPFEALRFLKDPSHQIVRSYRALCSDPGSILTAMHSDLTLGTHQECARKFMELFQGGSAQDRTVKFRAPRYLLAWRVDTPRRVILYTGCDTPDDVATPPRAWPKITLADKSKRKDPCVIEFTPTLADADGIRHSLLAYVKSGALDTGFREQVRGMKSGAEAHTLEEALLKYAQPPAENHSEVQLNHYERWDRDHIDSRCVA